MAVTFCGRDLASMHDLYKDDRSRERATVCGIMRPVPRATPAGTAKRQAARTPGGRDHGKREAGKPRMCRASRLPVIPVTGARRPGEEYAAAGIMPVCEESQSDDSRW